MNSDTNKTLLLKARLILEKNALNRSCISYKDFASEMGFTEAPIIASVTRILEQLIEQDVSAGNLILAAVVVQQGKKAIPRPGFFEKLQACGMLEINNINFDREKWHQNELIKIYSEQKNE